MQILAIFMQFYFQVAQKQGCVLIHQFTTHYRWKKTKQNKKALSIEVVQNGEEKKKGGQ